MLCARNDGFLVQKVRQGLICKVEFHFFEQVFVVCKSEMFGNAKRPSHLVPVFPDRIGNSDHADPIPDLLEAKQVAYLYDATTPDDCRGQHCATTQDESFSRIRRFDPQVYQ